MPAPSRLTSKQAVLDAMKECDELGREAFLAKYAYGRSTIYMVKHAGRRYDSKALLAAAWARQFPDEPPLAGFGGGNQTTSVLERLGFVIEDVRDEAIADDPLAGVDLAALEAAFARFRADPIELVRVAARRFRAGQIRERFARGEIADPETFEREVWRMETSTTIDGVDHRGLLFGNAGTDPATAERFAAAIARGTLIVQGNFIWREGSSRWAPTARTAAARQASVDRLGALVTDPNLTGEQLVSGLLDVDGIGIGVATGLAMITHPAEIALFNSVAPELAARVGAIVQGREGYQRFAKALADELGCDLLELDWFLYQINRGVLDLRPGVDPPPAPKGTTPVDDLNLIYYGPPGTGKTYQTVARALEIIDGAVPPDRKEAIARFAQLRDANRIAFVTFHQSYSYEEFVECIRPVLASADDEGDGDVQYEIRPGAFKTLCEAARSGHGRAAGPGVDPSKHRIWKISLGNTRKASEAYVYDDAIENGHIALGYGPPIDLGAATDREAVLALLPKTDGADPPEFEAQTLHRFKNEMAIGDLVVVSDGNHKFRAIGRVTGGYHLLDRDEYAHARPVEWLRVEDPSLPSDLILKKVFSQSSFYELRPSVLKLDALRDLLHVATPGVTQNYVMIIDEINRGNVAKILGELITLLEPDKRIEAPNELRVRLPHSREDFGVPANLYVIGTMNTADRSIAFLDTALRRRFRFVELMPDLDLLRRQVGVVEGVDVAALVEVLNRRIELLYDRDHALGHAFFLPVRDLAGLRDVFVHRVVPLLQEYFYDDWKKIGAVLGCPSNLGSGSTGPTLLSARSLTAEDLLPGLEDEVEEKLAYQIAPGFLAAAGSALAPFFVSITRPAGR